MELKGKSAIVTGSARGIGEGIALVLARQGANVVVNSRKPADCAAVVEKITALGGTAIAVGADVSQKAEAQALAEATLKEFGTIDILVNNAGTEAPPSLAVDLPEEQWDRILGTNLKSVFLCCQAVLPTMMQQKRGRIVNIGSIAGIRMGFFGSVDYTVSKHGVVGLTKHLAWELADFHITVNAVCPGFVQTPLMVDHIAPEVRDAVTKRMIPFGRMCEIGEIGEAVGFLASDGAGMITGQILAVDGGLLTGYGEDLRPLVRKRMAEAKTAAGNK
jgi:NAD(P)-dependent dehydrogenase (short-subunit alcohol dehydrogenase family)